MSIDDTACRSLKGTFKKKTYFRKISNLTKDKENQQHNEENEDEEENDWKEGRRIVELSYLANELKHCKNCTSPLFLHNCQKERRYGLGSILYVKCDQCYFENHVSTGKRHRADGVQKGMQIWDINTKLSLAYIDAGMGPNQTVNFLAAMNIPPITVKNLKEREREIGKILESCTDESCHKALQEEIALTKLGPGGACDDSNMNKVAVSFDGGWQKRGSGRSYSSLTGHATMIGEISGKCVKRGVKSTDCRKCLYTDENDDADHDCRKNYQGSAKSMESALAVSMASELQTEGCKISCIIMDDDSTTISRLRKSLDYDIEKRADKNHNRKNIVGDLYKLHERFKGSLSSKTITYLTKNIDYAIAQNQTNAGGLEKALQSIVPHSFGDHSNCSISWCNYLKDPENYKHKSLPHGKDLSGEELFTNLSTLFDQYAKNSTKMSNLGSSQGNESLNQNIAMKAPKAKHFGGSASLNFRVDSACIQKNEGRSYIPKVYDAHNLSPGKFTQRHVANLDNKRKKKKETACLPETKKKRVEKKQTDSVSIKTKEVREGTTYSTSVAHGEIPEDQLITIPEPIQEIKQKPVHLQNQTNVFFDFETTGFGSECDIIQLAATYGNDNTFNKYILPQKKIMPSASKVTGFSKSGHVLFKRGEIMVTDSKRDTFENFVSWLPENCILIGHNCKAFDCKILMKALEEHDLVHCFEEKCDGFVDTLPLIKECMPERKKDKKSFSQETLLKDILGVAYDAHDAVGDVKALKELYNSLHISKEITEYHTFTVEFVSASLRRSLEIYTRQETFLPIGPKVSKTMVKKMASSGLELSHVKLAYMRGKSEGVRQLLGETTDNGKPRVTKNKKTINSIISCFENQ